jgi:hypothetical protein
MNAMLSEWMAVERNRIAVMEQWPEEPRKEAGLAAARSSLDNLARNMRKGCSVAYVTYPCMRQTPIEIPRAQGIRRPAYGLAA